MHRLTIILLLIMSFSAFCEDAFISDVHFGGKGCSSDEAMAVLSPDAHTLSLLFDNYLVEAGGELGKKNNKICNVNLSIAVPEDKRVVIKKIDYRGYAFIPENARMRFISAYNIEIPSLNFQSKNFRDKIYKLGEFDEEIFFEQSLKQKPLKKACGQDFKLKIQTKLFVVSEDNSEVMASIDSLDSGINYHFEYEDCVSSVIQTPRSREQRRIKRERAERENRKKLLLAELRKERIMRRGSPSRANREQLRRQNRERTRALRKPLRRRSVSVWPR